MTKTLTKGNRAVIINVQEGDIYTGGSLVWANLYVNARDGIQNADITLTRWEGKTLKGAERWAEKMLSR